MHLCSTVCMELTFCFLQRNLIKKRRNKILLADIRFFSIRTSKFCWGSLFFKICWLLQPQFVLNLFLFLYVSALTWEIKTKRQGIEKQCWSSVFLGHLCIFIQDYWSLCILSSLAVLAYRSIFFCCPTILQDSVKFQLETFSLYF